MNKQLRILILEDDNADAELMEHELKKANFTFTSNRVETREAFLENLENFAPDLILADYTLPSFDGCSALRIAKEKCPDVPFIFVSGTIGEDFAIESLKSGATDYILKDRLSRLAPAVHRSLREVEEKIEYRKAEKEKERLLKAIDNSNDGIIIADEKDRYIYMNEAYAKIYGYAEEELIGETWRKLVPPESIAATELELDRTIHNKNVGRLSGEFPGIKKDGTNIPIEVRGTALWDENGNYDGHICIVRDITARKQAEEKLLLFRKLIDQSNDAIFVNDPETGRILDANDKACTNLGYNREEILDMRVMDFEINIPDQFSWKEHVEEVRNRGHLILEGSHRRKDGTIFPIEVNVSFIVLGENNYMVAEVRDITERKQTEEALQISEKKYSTLVEKGNDGIVIIQDGLLKFINSKMAEIAGYTITEAVGKPFSNFIFSDCRGLVIDNYKMRMSGEKVQNKYEIKIISKDGRNIPVEVNASLIDYEGKPAEMAIIRDINERKQAEEQIIHSLREKEVLLREIHHRVKNNMQIVSSLLGLQAESIKEKKYLEMFKDSRNRIMSMYMIHEKLYRSRDLEKIEFNEYITDLASGLLQSHGVEAGTVKLNLNVGDTSLGIDFAIPCGLIINELITNSLKYAFPDGRIGEISVSLHPFNKNMFELVVSDNGVGFPSDVDFRKTESLGLRLVTILAENQLHGQIDLERAGGTRFRIKFKGGK
ncbi:Methyl sulfide methyltransferase-associated sensor [uncultured archaeon]|nr:Methyl sulfide methyltransferase-associated sensor [uncultured archaeon]